MPASYSLGSYFEAFVQRQVRSGRFASASEVVREGLRLMEDRELRIEALRAAIEQGREGGPGIAGEDVFARARARIDAIEREAADRCSVWSSPQRRRRTCSILLPISPSTILLGREASSPI